MKMENSNLINIGVTSCVVPWLFILIVESRYLPLLAIGNMEDILIEEHIMPGILNKVPLYIAEVTYNNETVVSFGNRIPRRIHENPPILVRWIPDCHRFYTIIFTDIDANPKWPQRERQLWIIGNIEGESYGVADNITDYAPPQLTKGSGPHRILTVMFEQTDKIDFKEPVISTPDDEHRNNFSTLKFAEKYHLGKPNAANFFTVEYEES